MEAAALRQRVPDLLDAAEVAAQCRRKLPPQRRSKVVGFEPAMPDFRARIGTITTPAHLRRVVARQSSAQLRRFTTHAAPHATPAHCGGC
jgi:hypothetical protein